MKIPFLGQAYVSRSLPLSAQECINLYPEINQEARSVVALHGTPGTDLKVTCGSGPHRGALVMDGVAYVVSGTSLYSVSSGFTATSLGTISGTDFVSMATNGTQLVIVNGTAGYIYTTGGGLVSITDPDFDPSDTVAYLDGYFIFSVTSTGQFFISAINDGSNVDSLDFATAESSPDDIVAIAVINRKIIILGETSIETWYNSGDADFPFERLTGAIVNRGCLSKDTVSILNEKVFFLADDKSIYFTDGAMSKRISTHAIEYAINSYSTVSDAYAFSYEEEGHSFYVITFPTGGKTWVYDEATDAWHSRKTYEMAYWKFSTYLKCYDRHLVGDYTSGNFYQMSLSYYDDDGVAIERIRTTQTINSDDDPIFMDELSLIMETGVGLASGQGSNPQVMLQWSDDGGRTWSNELWRSFGQIGEYSKRVIWRRLGRFRNRVFKAIISDPVKISLIDCFAKFRVGR